MYGLTYIGRWFNGLTVVMAVWIFLFSAPKVYRDNQVSDNDFDKVFEMKSTIGEVCINLMHSS